MDPRTAYDPDRFRATGHQLIDTLATFLTESLDRTDVPVRPVVEPEELLRSIDGVFPARPSGDLVESLLTVMRHATRVHHPRFVGHQVSAPQPESALVELVTAMLNNGMAVFEMGQAHTIMERHVVRFLCDKVGFGEEADGVMTGGGSQGNLTALLAARQAQAGYDVWTEGQAERFAVLATQQSHYCIRRAVQIMGWGSGGVVPVAVDDRFRMRADDLEPALRRAEADGRRVLAVVCASCSTANGAFDPIERIADFCAAHDLWLHVDGAHGASFLMSEAHRSLLAGIERADSVVWDLHKMMMLPSLITGVLFRDGRRSYEAFAAEASYLFGRRDPSEEWFNIGHRTLECTKRGMAVTAYASLRSLGTDFFAQHIDHAVALTRAFAELVRASEDFELATEPEGNIVCFRPVAVSAREAPDVDRLRDRIVEEGRFYLVKADLNGETFLRLTLINPLTRIEDLEELLDQIRSLA